MKILQEVSQDVPEKLQQDAAAFCGWKQSILCKLPNKEKLIDMLMAV